MTIQQLLYFTTTADCGSFSAAAKKLHLTQAAISSAVRDLERSCNASLFDRSQSPILLTKEGTQLYSASQALLQQYSNVEKIVDNLSTISNSLRIGFSTIFGSYGFASLVSQFRACNPEIQIFTVEDSYHHLSERLLSGQLDIVIASLPETYAAQFKSIPLFDDKLVFCANRDHPFAFRPHLTLADLAEMPLVILSDRFASSQRLMKAFSSKGLSPSIFHKTDQLYTVARFLEYNVAIGCYPLSAVQQNPRLVSLAVADFEQPPLAINLFWNGHRQLSACTQLFLDFAAKQRQKYINPAESEKTDQ